MFFDVDDEDEESGIRKPKCPPFMYITEGVKYFKLRMFDKALQFFNIALEKEPNNAKCLLGKAQCFMVSGMYAEAREIVETVLKLNPRSPEAKSLKGKVEFLLGDFERSFLTYSRAHNSRPNYGDFKLGYQMNGRAIENALRPPIALDSEDVEDILKLLRGEPREELDSTEYKKSPQLKLYEDDISLLKELLSEEVVKSIHPCCRYLLKYLEGRQKFWMYHDRKIRNGSKQSEANDGN
ncbi:tetratricopeptide repeat protein 25 [Trichonephila clavata]|uniref:Outer dynein arm-docking complex subunit 4 n=1 Tax=Trichonephila clavata TaxID=2740835 RepID=A0A8X6LR98_TRICU|nr:tetratricopeptide repeat protein 25 [Trichonephila clavata]